MRRVTPCLFFLILTIAFSPIIAQDECPAVVTQALDKLDSLCEATERNEACYANSSLYVEAQDDVSDFEFDSEGDIEGVGKIRTLSMSALDEDDNAWGVVLMQLQASLPDTLPGENVTFILFGDVELVNAVDSDDTDLQPMEAFYLRTGIGDAACEDAPESGLMIRTPEGQGEMTFSVNGVDIAVGSEVFLQAQPNDFLTGRVFNGSAAATTSFGETGGIAGTEFQIPLDGDLLPSGPPEPLRGYDRNNLNLPPRIFGEIREPLDEGQTRIVDTLIQKGSAPCGDEDFLPDCSEVIRTLGGDKCPLNDVGVQDCDAPPPPRWAEIGPPLREVIAPVLGRPEERQRGDPSFAPIPRPNEQVSLPDSVGDRIQRSQFGSREALSTSPILPERDGTELPSLDGDRRLPIGGDNQGTELPTLGGADIRLAPTVEVTSPPDDPQESLPAGCEPGICLRDAAEACKCSLCGVECPVDRSDDVSSPSVDTSSGEISVVPVPDNNLNLATPFEPDRGEQLPLPDGPLPIAPERK